MTQNDKQSDGQIYQKLCIIVDEILAFKEVLQPVFEELYSFNQPKTQSTATDFYMLKFNTPDFAGLLNDLKQIAMPDATEFYNTFAQLRDIALDVIYRVICVNVIKNDIIDIYFYNNDKDMHIYLYLAMLKSMSNSIEYSYEKLNTLRIELDKQLAGLLIQDDDGGDWEDDEDEEEEDSILPKDVDSFQRMKRFLDKALSEYAKEHDTERISNFVSDVQAYLEAFANGVEPEKEFDFSFGWETGNDDHHEIEYMNYHFESEMIQVSSGGSIYDKTVGSDSYTNWDYSIWLNGWDDNDDDNCRFSTVLELVRSRAKLSIENPDEYTDIEE